MTPEETIREELLKYMALVVVSTKKGVISSPTAGQDGLAALDDLVAERGNLIAERDRYRDEMDALLVERATLLHPQGTNP